MLNNVYFSIEEYLKSINIPANVVPIGDWESIHDMQDDRAEAIGWKPLIIKYNGISYICNIKDNMFGTVAVNIYPNVSFSQDTFLLKNINEASYHTFRSEIEETVNDNIIDDILIEMIYESKPFSFITKIKKTDKKYYPIKWTK